MNCIPNPILSLSCGNFYFNIRASELIAVPNKPKQSIKFVFDMGQQVHFTTQWDDENPALNYMMFERGNFLRLYSPRLHLRMVEFYGLPVGTSLQLAVKQADDSLYALSITEQCQIDLLVKKENAKQCQTLDCSPEANYRFRNRVGKKWEQGLYGLI